MSFKKLFVGLISFCALNLFAEDFKVILTIKNVLPTGKVFVSIQNSKENFKNHISVTSFCIEPAGDTLTYNTNLPPGEYAVCLYQDENSDGKLNTGAFGIPKEPFGFSNYDGKNFPGGFEKHKFAVTGETSITIPLVKF